MKRWNLIGTGRDESGSFEFEIEARAVQAEEAREAAERLLRSYRYNGLVFTSIEETHAPSEDMEEFEFDEQCEVWEEESGGLPLPARNEEQAEVIMFFLTPIKEGKEERPEREKTGTSR